jgi:hypothetical protein
VAPLHNVVILTRASMHCIVAISLDGFIASSVVNEESQMKKLAMGIVAVGIASVVSFGTFAAPKVGTFTGELMDSQCALQGGKHDNMIRVGQDEKACTTMCVKLGGTVVMYDAATKTTYKLDDQKKATLFAGQKVTVTGDLNEATKTIKVTSMAAAK